MSEKSNIINLKMRLIDIGDDLMLSILHEMRSIRDVQNV